MLLTPLMEQLREHFTYAWEHYAGRPVEQVFEQHEAIAAAVEACDAEAARLRMAEHIAFYYDILLTRLQERRADALPKNGNGAATPAERRSA